MAAGLVLLGAALTPAGAQQSQLDSLRKLYQIDYSLPMQAGPSPMRGAPGNSAGSSSAFGAGWGDVFVGAGYQHTVRYIDQNDGSVVAGFGLGNAQKYVGLEVALTSVSTWRRGVGDAGTMSLKLHRILPGAVGVAVGYENAATWGMTDGGQSLYAVASKSMALRANPTGFLGSLAVNVGVGNGRFRLEDDVTADKKTVNAFASVGVRVHERASLIADWTGQDLVLATSLVPFRSLPLVVTPGIADVTGAAGNGARFTIGAGMGFRATDLLNIVR